MSTTWDRRARVYDVCEGSHLRRGAAKSRLFDNMQGRVLFMAIGTGVDILCFPPHREIVAVDISPEMLRRAERRRKDYIGSLELVQADVMDLGFSDESFDTVVTSCTMCSVPDPVLALRQLYRVLRPGGSILMFEHVRSRSAVFGVMLDLMTLWTRIGGTEMNRDTVKNVRNAGFEVTQVESVYLDIILAIHGVKPRNGGRHGGELICGAPPWTWTDLMLREA